MRLFGGSATLALPFVFVPRAWMDSIHRGWLDMGPLPAEPIAGYLARSTSMLYFVITERCLYKKSMPFPRKSEEKASS
jgi:hypothetical protein